MSNNVATIDSPFASRAQAPAVNNSLANAEAERAIQEVQASMVIAKRFPRNQVDAMERIINACTRDTLAQTALYSYPRGGQEITGPSIRLAECIAQEWGNIQFGIRELSSQDGVSTVEAYAWDVQTNTRQVKVFQVGHTRYAGGQLKVLKDPRDIYEMIANNGARRLRACILGVIPGDVTEAAVRQCEVTQASSVEVTPETIKAMLDAFQKNYGVSPELIEKRIGKRTAAINPAQLLNLRKIYQSLKDGMSKAADWFDMYEAEETVGPKSSDLTSDLKTKKAAPAKSTPAAEEKSEHEPETAEDEDDVAGMFGGN